MNRLSNIFFCDNSNQMDMIRYDHILINRYRKMFWNVLHDRIYDLASNSQLRLGRFVACPYDTG